MNSYSLYLDLAYLVPEAAKAADRSIDACHDYAAATVINIGKEEILIGAMEKLIVSRLSVAAE